MKPQRPPRTIGVIGAGTMGAGIAQLACQAGAETVLHDPVPAALQNGLQTVRAGLARSEQRGRLTPAAARSAAARLLAADDLQALGDCELVIEAAPESLELKRDLFGHLSTAVVGPRCILATNTSSLLVTAIAAGADRPERVVGMHFFNPPPVMPLLEVVAGVQSSPAALAAARAAGEAMGKHVIDAVDSPGFLVNRCHRPFGLEALRLLAERAAAHDEIDRIYRLEGRFKMGPFELMDLVGLDVGLDVARSFYDQSFGEPRWRPSPITVRQVAAGRLGRKSGAGFYAYPSDGAAHRPPDPEPPAPGHGDGIIVVAGDSILAEALTQAGAEAGWTMLDPTEAQSAAPPSLILDLTGGAHDHADPLQGGPRALCCAGGSLAALDQGGSAIGFNVVPPLLGAQLVELTRGPDSAQSAATATERFFATLGKHTAWVGDGPGLVLGRVVAQLANEAAFALGEGIGSAADIDAGMRLGMSYPLGPLEWADQIGLDQVLTTLDALYEERREERYRPAPELARRVWSGRLGLQTGEGFYAYGS
jgi:3-hydroxybutyryl-CoA dehydrogenase